MGQIADVQAVVGYVDNPVQAPIVQLAGVRSKLTVPMLKEEDSIGVIEIDRQEVRPFTEKQIELVQNFASQAVIAIENARLLNELRQRTDDLSEALEQQTATSEVLAAISSSPGELEPVFRAMLENAVRICEAKFGVLNLHENGALRMGAMHNVPSAFADFLQQGRGAYKPTLGSLLDRVMRTKEVGHIADNAAEAAGRASDARRRAINICVPMLKENELIGTISIYRQEVRPFTEKQIKLLTNFAAQAVIAIENTRLLNELRELLEQQTATSEVLQVISSSPGALEPVFQAMLQNSVRICEATFGQMFLSEGDVVRAVANFGVPAALVEFDKQRGTFQPSAGGGLERVIRTKQVIHIADLTSEHASNPVVKLGGARSYIAVPMLKENELIGAIVIYRQEVRPFSDKQITLVTNFASQAVIAIENVRLLNELRGSLQQQTATADVLKVISRSTFDLQVVLDTLVELAARLCEADQASVNHAKGEAYQQVACFGYSPENRAYMEKHSIPSGRGSLVGRVVLEGKTIQIRDVLADPEYAFGGPQISGTRTMLGVPLLREGKPIGMINLQRKRVQPFTERQIELVTTFADQTVIALENTRLLSELRELLQQQTATADVLKVISRSTFDLQAVLDTLVELAARLCEADMASVHRPKGEAYPYVASYGHSREFDEFMREHPIHLDKASVLGRAVLGASVVQVPDVLADTDFAPGLRERAMVGRFRTVLGVPLLREGTPIGVIMLTRSEVRPFTQKQIDLVTTFADQAVIAIENVRLFDEVQARTSDLARSVEELRALGEVSQAVNSTLELQTVFDTIVANSARLSGTEAGAIYVLDERQREFQLRATYGMSEELIAAIRNMHAEISEAVGLETETHQPRQVADLRDLPPTPVNDTILRAGYRARLLVPLMRSGDVVGALVVRRKEPGEFPQAVVSLMQTFAEQSAIALENARLFNEIAQKSRELEIASQHKSQFVANMSHELRTPLAAILGYAELIQEGFYGPLPEKSMDVLTRIRSNGKHLLGLINSVLDIAKVEFGAIQLEPGGVCARQCGRNGARGNRVPGRNQEALAQD